MLQAEVLNDYLKAILTEYISILYADIVNFTPLSEKLSSHDLVATLNQLFR